jgi:Cu/Ag efflux pump CusA
MFALNFSLDNISLMGLTIAVGFVVDDAIVVVENIYRHVEDGMTPFEAALKGSGEIAFTVVSISVSLVAVFIPILLMGGVIGRVFREFALTVTASIAISARVSLTLGPMLCARFMRPKTGAAHGRLYRRIEAAFDAMLAGYRRSLDVALRHQAIMLGVFLATIAITVVMAIQIPKGFFPIQDTGLISGVSEASQEVSPYEMMRLQQELGEIILRIPTCRRWDRRPVPPTAPLTVITVSTATIDCARSPPCGGTRTMLPRNADIFTRYRQGAVMSLGPKAGATASRGGGRFLGWTCRRRPGSRRLVLMWWTAPAPGIEVP